LFFKSKLNYWNEIYRKWFFKWWPEFNEKLFIEDLSENDKKEFLRFYEKYLKSNLESCFEINENITNIIKYISKICKINNNQLVSNIINNGGFYNKINNNLKRFFR